MNWIVCLFHTWKEAPIYVFLFHILPVWQIRTESARNSDNQQQEAKMTESRLNRNVETPMQCDSQLYTGNNTSMIKLHTA
jgi:hypothetical protein